MCFCPTKMDFFRNFNLLCDVAGGVSFVSTDKAFGILLSSEEVEADGISVADLEGFAAVEGGVCSNFGFLARLGPESSSAGGEDDDDELTDDSRLFFFRFFIDSLKKKKFFFEIFEKNWNFYVKSKDDNENKK